MKMEKATKKMNIGKVIGDYKTILILVGLVIVAACASPHFMQVSNIMNILQQVSIIGIVSIGMSFVILTGGIDLSVGPCLSLITILVALLQQQAGIVSILAAVGAGFAIGIVNGLIITRCNVQPFIVTLGMMSVLKGIALTISQGSPISGTAESIQWIGRGKIAEVFPTSALLMIAIAVIAAIILKYTPLGRYTYAIGGNPEATRLSGINVENYTMIIYGISGLLAGFAAILMATKLDMGKSTVGDGMEMDAIAAAVIGGISLRGGVGKVSGTIIGVFIIGILANLLNLLNVSGYTQNIFKGAIIVAAAILQGLQDRKR